MAPIAISQSPATALNTRLRESSRKSASGEPGAAPRHHPGDGETSLCRNPERRKKVDRAIRTIEDPGSDTHQQDVILVRSAGTHDAILTCLPRCKIHVLILAIMRSTRWIGSYP